MRQSADPGFGGLQRPRNSSDVRSCLGGKACTSNSTNLIRGKLASLQHHQFKELSAGKPTSRCLPRDSATRCKPSVCTCICSPATTKTSHIEEADSDPGCTYDFGSNCLDHSNGNCSCCSCLSGSGVCACEAVYCGGVVHQPSTGTSRSLRNYLVGTALSTSLNCIQHG